MKATALIVMLMATALIVSAASPQEGGAAKNQQEESAGKIKELQKERLEALSAAIGSAGILVRDGRALPEVAEECRHQLLQAQIEYAANDAQRIQFYESDIKVLKQSEEIAIARKESARASEMAVQKAKAARLEAEIALERLKAKVAK